MTCQWACVVHLAILSTAPIARATEMLLLTAHLSGCLCEQTSTGYTYLQPTGVYATPHLTYGAPSVAQQALPESFHKEFYSFTAPNDDLDDALALQRVLESSRQGIRVVFIRTPEQRVLEQAALGLAKQAYSQRTAIYVLNRQPDIGQLAGQLDVLRSHHNQRPEVHFVKYRTPEEAAQAQQLIRAQYDVLHGSTHAPGDDVAPVLNFASAAAPPQHSYAHVAPEVSPSYQQASHAASYGSYESNLLAGSGEAGTTDGGESTLPGAIYGLSQSAVPLLGYARSSSSSIEASASSSASVPAVSNVVSKINERLSSGSRLVFPTEATPSANTYLPPLKRKRAAFAFAKKT